jgi:hypothetical protein
MDIVSVPLNEKVVVRPVRRALLGERQLRIARYTEMYK